MASATGSDTKICSLEPEETIERKIHNLEAKISELIDESVMASWAGNKKKGLELAKEAEHKESLLVKQEEEVGFTEHNWAITFSVSSQSPQEAKIHLRQMQD